MKRRQFLRLTCATFALAAVGVGCGSGSGSSTTTTSTTAAPPTAAPTTSAVDDSVTVFAASSLTASFTDIAAAFEAAHPGSKVTLNFAASSELAAQINQGAPADVFASADLANMKKLTAGTIGAASEFATNRLQIIVAPGNPKGITGIADLAKPGVTFVSADPSVPIGKYAQQVLDKAGVKVKPASLEANVKGIVTKVTLGEADAGIVYVTDVLAAGAKAQGVDIPDDINVVAHYPIGVPANSAHAAAGADFVAFVLSSAGQQILAKYGFASA